MQRIIGVTLAALTLASSVESQQPERRAATPPPAPPAAQPRVGYAAPPPPPPQQAPVQVAQPVYYYYSPNGYDVYGAPYLVLNDGSVLVNFGYGYERVLRQCAPVRSTAQTEPWARDALGRIPEPPGIAALRAGTRGQMAGHAPARNAQACYRTDGQRVEVVTTR